MAAQKEENHSISKFQLHLYITVVLHNVDYSAGYTSVHPVQGFQICLQKWCVFMKTDLNVSKLWPCGGNQSLQWNNMDGKQFPWRMMLQAEVHLVCGVKQSNKRTSKHAFQISHLMIKVVHLSLQAVSCFLFPFVFHLLFKCSISYLLSYFPLGQLIRWLHP